jgi:hypothetical protein
VYRLETPHGGKDQLISHTYIRAKTSVRLSTTVVRGDFKPSVIVIQEGKRAWLAVPGRVQTTPVGDAKRKVEKFSPDTGPIRMALALPQAFGSAAAWRGLQSRAVVQHEGRDHYRLTPAGDVHGHPLVSALIDAQTFRVSRMVLAAGSTAMVLEFSQYREIQDGVLVPFRIRTEEDGKLTKDIYLQTLDLDASIDPVVFEKPAAL